jgi:hypothetical protein
LAQFGQLKVKADGLTVGVSLHDQNERAPELSRVSKEQDQEQDVRARRYSKEQDREQDGFISALRNKTIGSRAIRVALSIRSHMAPTIRSVTVQDLFREIDLSV